MKYCEDYAALLDLYADGELEPEELERVQAHLDTCPACRAYVDDALAIRAAFPEIEETEVPDGFAGGVMAAIRAGDAPQPTTPRKQKKTPWAGVLVSLAACCAIVILQQNGPLSAKNNSASVAYDTAAQDAAFEDSLETAAESIEEDCGDIAEPEEGAPRESFGAEAKTTGNSGAEAQSGGSQSEKGLGSINYSEGISVTPTDEGKEEIADEAPAEAEAAPDQWVEYENVVFSAVVCLSRNDVGDALDGYEGKPYSNPEAGVSGTGYALGRVDFERILSELNGSPEPVEGRNPTTELCCIVVTG